MYFIDDVHKNRFMVLKAKADQGNDCEYSSALYVLAALGKPIEKYVQPGAIEFKKLKQVSRAWSSSEKAMLKLAATLFNNSTWSVRVADVFRHLDEENTRVALQGLEIRYLMR
jgi:hypothetical protein